MVWTSGKCERKFANSSINIVNVCVRKSKFSSKLWFPLNKSGDYGKLLNQKLYENKIDVCTLKQDKEYSRITRVTQ